MRKLPTFDHVYAQALASLPEITVLDTLSYYANEAKNDILLRRRTLLSLVRVLQKLGVPARYLEGHPSMNALSERLGYQRSVISAMKDDYLLAKPASFERNSELLWWLGYVE